MRAGKRWRFPQKRSELPGRFKPVFLMPVDGKSVLYALPILKHHPDHWFHKDELVGKKEIDPVVQQAVNRTLPREYLSKRC